MDMQWLDGIDGAVTVCDIQGIIIYMNERSAQMFKDKGGLALVGKSLFDCHDEKINEQIRLMLKSHSSNVYTTEKNGIRKLIWQAPWDKDGVFAGLVEVVLPIPGEMRHFVRKSD